MNERTHELECFCIICIENTWEAVMFGTRGNENE